jgi:hypothetical protein
MNTTARKYSIAPLNTKCVGSTPYSGSRFTCGANNGDAADAVHTWEGKHYCGYHSPFDVTTRDREELAARTAPETIDTPQPTTSELPEVADWFRELLLKREECADADAFERAAYNGYVSYGIGGTDGYYVPEGFDLWVLHFRQGPIMSLYMGNDQRGTLARTVLSYMRLRNIAL